MDQFYKKVIENSPQGYAYHRIIINEHKQPIDYEYIEVNDAFEDMTGLSLSKIKGKTFTQLFPNLQDSFDWIGFYGKIALGGPSQYFEQHFSGLNRHFKIYAFSPEPMSFVTLFTDITQEINDAHAKITMLKALNDIVCELDEDLRFINVFTNYQSDLFFSIDDMLKGSIHTLFPDDFKAKILPVFSQVEATLTKQSVIYPSIFPYDHRWYKADIMKTKILDTPRYILSITDITDQKKAEDELKETSLRLQQLAEHTHTMIWECDQNGLYTYFSNTVERVLGYKPEELIGKHYFYDLHPQENREKFIEESFSVFRKKGVFLDMPNAILTKDGNTLYVTTNGFPILNEDGTLKGYRGSDMDITERRRLDEALRNSEQKYRLITENTSDVIWVLNAQSLRFTYVSPSITALRGYTSAEAVDQSLEETITEDTLNDFKTRIDEGIQTFIDQPNSSLTQVHEIKQPCKDGSVIWVEVSTKFRFDENNQIEIIGVSRNIEARKQAEKDILFLSYHDQLTSVYNRTFYEEELKRLNTDRNLPFTLVVCDINGLKLTNDAFGHMAGDRLIISFANILKKVCRKDDIISRIGGDEFALLLPKTTAEVAKIVVGRIMESIASSKPDKIKLSVSFGWKTKVHMEDDFAMIFKEAEDMMYHDKIKNQPNFKKSMIDLITSSLYQKYPEEKEHAYRVSALSRRMGEAMILTHKEVNDLELAGLLHDIGKIGLEDGLINQNDYVSFDETPEFKRHSEVGYQITRSVYEFSHIAEIILGHHECYDGSGYPKGLKGENIPLMARILKITNDYSSAIDRDHKSAQEALDFIKAYQGSHFDPQLIKIFVQLMESTL